MSIIDFEIEEIRKLCENVVPNSKIITCTADPPALVRVDINDNKNKEDQQQFRSVTALLRFPAGYPQQLLLIELKSRSRILSDKFLNALTKLCEAHAREQLSKPQVLHVLRFIQQYIHENPLCVCFDEIQQLRGELSADPSSNDQLKLKQRKSSVKLFASGGAYYYRVEAIVPNEYPQRCVELQEPESNLPGVLQNYLNGQSREIARRCVEPPLALAREKRTLESFKPVPSLYCALKFVLDATRDFHAELCPICEKNVLPAQPAQLELNNTNDAYIERVFCGHLFHQGCLKSFMEIPPFPKGGKLCPAKRRHLRSDANDYVTAVRNKSSANSSQETTCGLRLSHDRWVINPKLAEARWAKKQARERELQEVEDFWK